MNDLFETPISCRVHLAVDMFPSFSAFSLTFAPPDGFRQLNPSIFRISGRLVIIQRTVRYGQSPVITRNFWVDLDDDFVTQSAREIVPNETYLPRARGDCIGLEDIRPFEWGGVPWGISSAREFNSKGWWSEIVLSEFYIHDPAQVFIHRPFVVPPVFGSPRNEKNWMVIVNDDGPIFVYSVAPLVIIDRFGKIVININQDIPVNRIRGGTQMLPFEDGWVSFVHEVFFENERRFYGHRALYISSGYDDVRLSQLFFFLKPGVEFAAGIAYSRNLSKIYVSFGVEDRESWIATIDCNDLIRLLFDSRVATSG